MAIAIHAVTTEGIVAVSDSRVITRFQGGGVLTDDTVLRTIPFPNNAVVSYVGENMIYTGLNLQEFLLEFRDKYGKDLIYSDIPTRLLNDFRREAGKFDHRDVRFLVSGYGTADHDFGCYEIGTRANFIGSRLYQFRFNESIIGDKDIASEMFNVDMFRISLDGAIDLSRAAVEATVESAKYKPISDTGGERIDTYVINCKLGKTGWWNDGVITPDENIPDSPLHWRRVKNCD